MCLGVGGGHFVSCYHLHNIQIRILAEAAFNPHVHEAINTLENYCEAPQYTGMLNLNWWVQISFSVRPQNMERIVSTFSLSSKPGHLLTLQLVYVIKQEKSS
jgi:hypothetical protein